MFLLALAQWGDAEVLFVLSDKIGGRGIAADLGDLRNGHIGICDQITPSLHSQINEHLDGCPSVVFPEQPNQVVFVQMYLLRQLIQSNIPLQMVLHVL